jgi:hypothetical protein
MTITEIGRDFGECQNCYERGAALGAVKTEDAEWRESWCLHCRQSSAVECEVCHELVSTKAAFEIIKGGVGESTFVCPISCPSAWAFGLVIDRAFKPLHDLVESLSDR